MYHEVAKSLQQTIKYLTRIFPFPTRLRKPIVLTSFITVATYLPTSSITVVIINKPRI